MKKGKIALLALFMAFLGMFLVTSQNIKAEADDVLEENACIMIDDAEGNSYEYYGVMYEKGDVVTKSLSLKGPVSVTIVADNGSYCGYYSSCVTLRGDYYYNLNTTGTYTFTVIDYYGSNKEVYVTYNITITVTKIIDDSSGENSSDNSSSSGSSSGGSSSSSSSSSSSTGPVWYTDDITTIYGGTSIYVQLTSVNEIDSYSLSTAYGYEWLSSSGKTLSYGYTFTSKTSTKITFTVTAPFVSEDSECYLEINMQGKDIYGNLSTFEGKEPYSIGSYYHSSFKYAYTIIGDSEAPVWYTDDVSEVEAGEKIYFQLTDTYSGVYYDSSSIYYRYGWSTSNSNISEYEVSFISYNSSMISFIATAPIVDSSTVYYLWIYWQGKDNVGNTSNFSGKIPYSSGTYYADEVKYEYTIVPTNNDNEKEVEKDNKINFKPAWYTENKDEIISNEKIYFQLTSDSSSNIYNCYSDSYYGYGWSTSSTSQPSTWQTDFTSQTSTKIAFSTIAPGVITSSKYYLWILHRGKNDLGYMPSFEGKQPYSSGSDYYSSVIYQYTILPNNDIPFWSIEDKTEIKYGETIKVELIGNNIADYASSYYKYGWSGYSYVEPSSWLSLFALKSSTNILFYTGLYYENSYFDFDLDTFYEYEDFYLWVSRGSNEMGNISGFVGKEPYVITDSYLIYRYSPDYYIDINWYTENVDSVVSLENIYFTLRAHSIPDDNYISCSSCYKYGWSTSSTSQPPNWENDLTSSTSTKIAFSITAPYVTKNTTYYLWLYRRGDDASDTISSFEGKKPYSSGSYYSSYVIYQYTILSSNDNDIEAPVWNVENKSEIISGETILMKLTDNKSIWKSSYPKIYYKYGWSTSSTTKPSSWKINFSKESITYIELNVTAPSVITSTTYYLWIYYRGQDTAGNIASFNGKQPYSSGSTYNSNIIYQYTIIPDDEAPIWYTENIEEIKSGKNLYFQLTDNASIYWDSSISSYYEYGWSFSSTSRPSTWQTDFTSQTSTKIAFTITAPVVTSSNKTYYLWIMHRGLDKADNLAMFSGKQPFSYQDNTYSVIIYEYTIIVDDTELDTESPVWYTKNITYIETGKSIDFELTDNANIDLTSYYYKHGWSASSTTTPSSWNDSFTYKTSTKVAFSMTAPAVTKNTTYYLWINYRGKDTSGNVSTFSGKEPYSSGTAYNSYVIYKYIVLLDTTSPIIKLNSQEGMVAEDKSISYYSNVPLTLLFEDNLYFKKYVVSGPVNYTGTGDRYIISSAGSYSITAYDYAGNMTSIAIEINDDGTVPSKAIINDATLNEGQITFTIAGSNNIQEEYKNGIAVYFVGKYGNYSTDVLLEDGFKKYGVTYSPSNNMPASKFFEKGAITTPQGLIGNVELYIMLKLDDKDTNPIILKSGSIEITNKGSVNIIFNSSETEVVSNEVKEITLSTSNIVIKENIRKPNYMLFVSMIVISSLLALEVIVIRKHKKAHN